MTNEEYIKAIDMRTSRRTYKARALDKSILEVLKNMVDAVNEASGLEFQLVEDGTPAFKIFSGRFSYIAVCGEDSEAARIKSGYWGESIVLQCVYHGLGTCWVSGTYDENKVYKAIDLPKKHRLYAVIVVGYVKDKLSAKEKLMYNATHKNNKPYQKMFEVCDKKLPPYYEYAMKLVEKAPSLTAVLCISDMRTILLKVMLMSLIRIKALISVLRSSIFSLAQPQKALRANGIITADFVLKMPR